MLIELFWTADLSLVSNTLVPALNFLLVLVLFGSLVTYHDAGTVLQGMSGGFLVGAILYTSTTGFPFAYPPDFSYNAIATMYTFGLFITLLYGCFRKSKVLIPIAGLTLLAHVVATTSIKANLGIMLGVTVAGLVYSRHLARVARRNSILLLAVIGATGYMLASSSSMLGGLERGLNRISIGVEILQAREDVKGYGSFTKRQKWQEYGLDGWAQNPVFGKGVESFRSEVGITSHSTPVDLLHNSGLIGFVLFYGMFAALAWRVFVEAKSIAGNVRLVILSALICFLFMTLTGTMHYNSFLAAFIAVSVGIVRQRDRRDLEAVAPSRSLQT
jgi:O-antigen ligase